MPRTLHSGTALDTLGKRIRHIRNAKGLKLGALANQLGISRTSLSQWEGGKVKNPDTIKLGEFSRICDCNLDWLIKGETDEQQQPTSSIPPVKRRIHARDNKMMPVVDTIIEVAASLCAHATDWDMTPRAYWSIPEQVLELGFNAEPEACIMKRVSTRDAEFGLDRGDFVLIDTSRRTIDEPGIYVAADPQGQSARRVLVTLDNTELHIALIADDNEKRESPGTTPVVIGRVMGIFKPA